MTEICKGTAKKRRGVEVSPHVTLGGIDVAVEPIGQLCG